MNLSRSCVCVVIRRVVCVTHLLTAVQAAQIALAMRMHSQCIARARARRFMTMRVRDARTDGHGGAVAH